MKTNHELESIFAQALELADPSLRGSFLDRACEGNAPLRNRVSRLLLANDQADRFMAEPATVFKLPHGAIDAGIFPIGEQPGDVVGRYTLLEQIGEGGMGTVFAAKQHEPVTRKVALKIIKPGLDTKEVVARFEAERQALALMNHPHIAQALDAGATAGGRPFFVMELVEGTAITDYCNHAHLSLRERLQLFRLVCDAVQHAHHKGIIHRDIKPRNILVQSIDGEPVPKVIDFGIAKAVDYHLTQQTLITRYGEFIGTPSYMSPEQAQLAAVDVDTRTDVYSLGALLYELVTGLPPFDEAHLRTLEHDEMRRFIQQEAPRRPSDRMETRDEAEVPRVRRVCGSARREWQHALAGELNWIVMRAMDKDRERRYETASALSQDVQRYLANEAVIARPPTLSYRTQKFLSRNRSAATMGLVVALCLLLTTVMSGWWAWQATAAQRKSDRMWRLADQKSREAADARDAAAEEAASLQQVMDFINRDLFLSASPRQEPNRTIRLRSIVDRAAARLNSQTFSRPLVEASIRTTLGETYRALGEYALAREHLDRALERYSARLGRRHENTLAAANRLVGVLLHQNQFAEAEAILRDNLATASEALGEDHEVTLAALNLEAWRLEAIDELGEAEQLLAHIYQHRIDRLGSSDPQTLKAMANLGYIYQSQGRVEDALPLLESAYEGLSQGAEAWQPDVLKISSSLASMYLSLQQLDKAEALYQAVAAQAEAGLGPQHSQTLTSKHGLALVLVRRKQYEAAAELFETVLQGQRDQLGNEHTNTLATMHNLALLQQSLGAYDQAEALFREELAGRESTLGAHPSTRDAAASLAFLYVDQLRFADAIPYYQAALQNRSQLVDLETLTLTTMLGVCQWKSGDGLAARATLASGLQLAETFAPDHWLRFVVESLLGEVLHRGGERDRAERALTNGYQGLKRLQADVPAHWKPLGIRAATRRLVAFYESGDSSQERSRAREYRDQLQSLIQGGHGDPSAAESHVEMRNKQDGDPN